MTKAPELKLRSGATIPQIGLGTWPMKGTELERTVCDAIEIGYRHFDTAVNYGNEDGVGNGIRRIGIGRSEVFVTTKVPGRDHGLIESQRSLDESLQRMNLDYVDLLLIHWPNPKNDRFVDAWRGLIEAQSHGKARSIGVSNFKRAHIDRLISETGVAPDVNQIQLYPAVGQSELRSYNEQHGIITESWSPLGKGANAAFFGGHDSFLEHPIITSIADEIGQSRGQVVLRWHVQLGLVPLPKSSNPDRLRENIDVFSFELTSEQMTLLSSIDDGSAEIADSDEHQEL